MLEIGRDFPEGVPFYMTKLIKEIPLANGLVIRFFDATRRYFGDYHQVRIQICCEVPLSAALFEDVEAHQRALKILGNSVLYKKDIEHQGVATDAIPDVVANVLKQFVDHSLGYFNGEAFPKKLVQSELNRIGAKSRSSFTVRGLHG